MRNAQSKVTDFHEKFGFHVNRDLVVDLRMFSSRDHHVSGLVDYVNALNGKMLSTFDETGNVLSLRLHLMLEEIGETLAAARDDDVEGLIDGVTDLLYVVIGFFVTYGIDLESTFSEIHRSNMTKSKDRDRPGHPRKGKEFESPRLLIRVVRDLMYQRTSLTTRVTSLEEEINKLREEMKITSKEVSE